METKPKKPRAKPVRGVRFCAQSYCDKCGWIGAHWYGKGSMANAHGELRYHREKAKCT